MPKNLDLNLSIVSQFTPVAVQFPVPEKEKAIEASAKHAVVGGGGGVCERSDREE